MLVKKKELNIDSSYGRGLFILAWRIFWRCTKNPRSDCLPNNFELEVNLNRSGKQSLAGFSLMTAVNHLCCAAATSTRRAVRNL
jgi:hypothetical protein